MQYGQYSNRLKKKKKDEKLTQLELRNKKITYFMFHSVKTFSRFSYFRILFHSHTKQTTSWKVKQCGWHTDIWPNVGNVEALGSLVLVVYFKTHTVKPPNKYVSLQLIPNTAWYSCKVYWNETNFDKCLNFGNVSLILFIKQVSDTLWQIWLIL